MGDVVQFPTGGFTERLMRAGQHEKDTREAHRLALTSRNALVHEAVDNGYPQSSAARDAQISRPSVTRILSMPPGGNAAA